MCEVFWVAFEWRKKNVIFFFKYKKEICFDHVNSNRWKINDNVSMQITRLMSLTSISIAIFSELCVISCSGICIFLHLNFYKNSSKCCINNLRQTMIFCEWYLTIISLYIIQTSHILSKTYFINSPAILLSNKKMHL